MSRHNSKSGLFLMEMIIVILFFSICAAICVNVFAKARVTADSGRALNSAAIRSANIAETYKAAGGDLGRTAELLKEASDGDLVSVEADGSSGELIAVYDNMTVIVNKDAVDTNVNSGLVDIKAYDKAYSDGSAGATDNADEIFEMRARA